MKTWLKAVVASLGGGLALFGGPGLESSQNTITSAIHISGQPVVFVWLLLSFVWAFSGALVSYTIAAAFLYYVKARGWGIPLPSVIGLPLIKSLAKRLLSDSVLFRALPLLLVIAVVVTLGYLVLSRLGYDSQKVQVADSSTGEVRDFRIVTVLPRDAIPAIIDPRFVPASEAAQWMDDREQVIGLEIEGEAKAYPINILSRHEIVNDVVGGRPVAVTW